MTPGMFLSRHLGLIAFLGLVHLGIVMMDSLGHHRLMGLAQMFRLSREGNVPAIFSAAALMLAGAVAVAIANRLEVKGWERKRWYLAGIFFIFLGFDEASEIHERMFDLVAYVAPSVAMHKTGVLVYVPVVVALTLFYFRWWWRQRTDIRSLIAVAGACYMAAAVGVELLERRLMHIAPSEDSPMRGLYFLVEECGEMVAVALFVNAFLRRLAMFGPTALTLFEVRPEPVPAPATAPASPAIRIA